MLSETFIKDIHRICNLLCTRRDLVSDLQQEVLLCFLEMPESKYLKLQESGQANRYASGVIKIMLTSKNSPFFKKHINYAKRRVGDGSLQVLERIVEKREESF